MVLSSLPSHSSVPEGSKGAEGRRQALAWAAVFFALSGVIQFLIVSVPYDADTAYHAAVGQLIRQHGILHSFPWTPFSWLADHYADKELLLHLLFAALGDMDWIIASKIVGTLLGGGVLLALYLVLRAEGVRYAGVWALVPLVVTDVFLFRFALVRPHLFSIAFAVAALWAASRKRLVPLGVISALYPWAYVAWQLPLVLVAAAEAARLLSGRRPEWKPAAVALAGIAVGVAAHPNAGNLLQFTWVQIVEVLLRTAWGARSGIELGLEFLPFTLSQWLRWLPVCVFMAGAGLFMAWRSRREGSTALAFALATLGFGLLTVKTARFAEYFIPFSVAAFALTSGRIRRQLLLPALLCVAVLYAALPLSETVQGFRAREELLPRSLEAELQQSIPPGAQVFTCEWGLTGHLLRALPDRRFLVALDPTFLYMKSPELHRLWHRLSREAPPGTAELIRQRFGARYVVCLGTEEWAALFDRLLSEPDVRMLNLTEKWAVLDLGGRR